MNKDDFKKLQEYQLQIMDEIHRICTENKLNYYLVYGSAIGALRHKGFIPWDVDIDVAMLRDDYERFKIVCRQKLKPRYEIHHFEVDHDYEKQHVLVCIKNTSLETFFDKYNKGKNDFGIFVDVFPVDNIYDDEVKRAEQKKKVIRLKKLKYRKISTLYSDSRWKRVAKWTIKFLLQFITLDKLNKRFDDICRSAEKEETSEVCCFNGTSLEKNTVPKDYYGVPREVEFEGRKYYIQEQAEKCLEKIYGDYMILPPQEEREANLDYFVSVKFD